MLFWISGWEIRRIRLKLHRSKNLILTFLLITGIITGCANNQNPDQVLDNVSSEDAVQSDAQVEGSSQDKELPEITIIYTNDIHSYINNTKTDDEGNEVRLLSYASVSGYKKKLEAEGKNVLLVDAGDHVQGTAFGGLDEGDSIIELMNATGYQLATLGNHEFDFGQMRAFQLMDEADFPYVSCNFYSTETMESVLAPYEILEIAGVKVAFVGISTPETITKSAPVYFEDETGNKIYDFYSGEDGQELYDAVQKAIDAASSEADYVIGLAHLGVDISSAPYRSTDVIANTRGFDAVIDGHSHTTMPMEIVKDLDGNDIVLTQTGSYFSHIGVMTIKADGSVETELIDSVEEIDETVLAIEDAWIESVNSELGKTIARSDMELVVMDPAKPDTRIVRNSETNLGDFVSDACYYYYNVIKGLECDVVITNGGGIRAALIPGDCSYLAAKTVNPFGNVVCLIRTKGINILDALEMGARYIGMINEETGKLAEAGGFLQVAGLTYEIDTSVESTIVVDEDEIYVGSPTGEYKVKNVKIYNRETGVYEDLDTDKYYTLGGINYLLRNHGSGLTMFDDSELIIDYDEQDYLVLSAYMQAFDKDEDGMPLINTENSPLKLYSGYLLDYDNPYGSKRIIIH